MGAAVPAPRARSATLPTTRARSVPATAMEAPGAGPTTARGSVPVRRTRRAPDPVPPTTAHRVVLARARAGPARAGPVATTDPVSDLRVRPSHTPVDEPDWLVLADRADRSRHADGLVDRRRILVTVLAGALAVLVLVGASGTVA